MRPALTIIDDFLPEFKAATIRQAVLSQGFKDVPFMGGLYQGTNMEYKPSWLPEAISFFFGNREIKIHVSAFRSGHKDTHLHVNIHADNPVGAEDGGKGATWAGVYYMSLPEDCRGGTAFYRMKETGWETMPTQAKMDEAGLTLEQVVDKWTKPEEWELTSIASMKYNRFIFYPTEYFHSRYPLEGWGKPDELEHARLVWVVFFDVL